jgi:hypothetical protein
MWLRRAGAAGAAAVVVAGDPLGGADAVPFVIVIDPCPRP